MTDISELNGVDDAMKVPVLFGNGRSWMAGVNIKSPKIFILPVDDVIRVRTGERGGEAV